MKNEYSRLVQLLCPTCGGNEFIAVGMSGDTPELQRCASCEREISKEDLIRENNENIEMHAKEVIDEISINLEKELKKRFSATLKGNKFIRMT